MAIIFSDNFDGEVEGTSPPANWVKDGVSAPTIFEVDDAQSHSPPHSAKLQHTPAAVRYGHHDEVGGFTDDKITFWLYFDNANTVRYLATQATIGNVDTAELMAFIGFRDDGDIEYYNGAWQDTGFDYTTGWHKLEIVLDVGNNDFDAWYDDTKIITNGDYYAGNTGKTSAKSLQIGVSAANLWFDDVQIGEGWTGKYLGVTNPAKINGDDVSNITKVNGVQSA